jgi:hypothetical protein
VLHGAGRAASVPGDFSASSLIGAGDTGERKHAILSACTGCALP